MTDITPVVPVMTVELFPPLSLELLAVLRALEPPDWSRPTVCGAWTVKDVAAHLLGGNFGRLWKRESSPTTFDEPDYDTLVELIDRENDLWVRAARRISPHMLVELLELTDQQLYLHFRSLLPGRPARIGVLWAGESLSLNWFDIAREYTEKWLHQQHIREAVGQPLLMERKWLYPVLDTLLRGLPRAYWNISAKEGTSLGVEITGEAGGTWTLQMASGSWRLLAGRDPASACRVSLDQDTAWRLFTKGITPEQARPNIIFDGDQRLGNPVLNMVSIMA